MPVRGTERFSERNLLLNRGRIVLRLATLTSLAVESTYNPACNADWRTVCTSPRCTAPRLASPGADDIEAARFRNQRTDG
jgi:hypothetical protein